MGILVYFNVFVLVLRIFGMNMNNYSYFNVIFFCCLFLRVFELKCRIKELKCRIKRE